MDPVEFHDENTPDPLAMLGLTKAPDHVRRRSQRKMKEAGRIVRDLEPISSAARIAGLLTCPELAANAHRLEQMIENVLCRANGKKRINAKELVQLFALFGKAGHGSMEDPAEDVFVSLVYFRGRNFRVFEGLWEASAFHLQRLIGVVESMPDAGRFNALKEQVEGLLTLSESVALRRGLARYCCGAEYPVSKLSHSVADRAAELSKAVLFTYDELVGCGIEWDHLAVFSTSIGSLRKIPEGGSATLRLTPLVRHSTGVLLAVPANVSTAIRFRVIDFADRNGMADMLQTSLAQEYTKLVEETQILGKSFGAPLQWRPHGNTAMGEVVQKIDTGRCIHFLFLLDNFEQFRDHDFLGHSSAFENCSDACQCCLDRVVEQFTSRPEYKEGMTIVVGCGWGRGLAMPVVDSGRNDWRVEVTSIEQLVTLSWSRGTQPLHLFRLLDHVHQLEQRNLQIINMNGLLNLYGFALSQGFHLAPHSALEPDMLLGDRPLMLSIPLEAIFEVRRQVAQIHDVHLAAPPDSKPVVLRRYHLNPYFAEDTELPLYGSIVDAASGTLRSVYEGRWLSVWLTSHTADSEDHDGLFRFWDAFTKWLMRIVPVIETVLGEKPATAIKWHIEYEMTTDPADFDRAGEDSAEDLFAQIETRVDNDGRRITSSVPRSVFVAFHQPKNFAEQAVLMSFVDGVTRLLGVGLHVRKTVLRAVGCEDAREFHLFEANEFADFVADKIPSHPILLEPFDDSLSRLGVASRVKGLAPGAEVIGTERCTSVLNRVVDSLWDDVRALLNRLDRHSTIEKLILNTLSTARSNRQWQRTIRAVLALHDDQNSTLRTAAEQIFRNNVASGSCRYAIEMAACECPESGGEEPGELELSRLMALIQLICQYGGWSDGIQYGAIPARIEVSALGLLLISGDFHENVLEPYGFGMESARLKGLSDEYKRLFVPHSPGGSITETTGDQFPEVWKEEFGFEIDEARLFLDELDDQAIKEQSPVVHWNRTRLVELAAMHMSEDSASRLIDELTIKHRAAWKQPPEGYSIKDIVPWRFKRRLSLVHRPIVQLTGSEDGPYVCSPESVRMGFALRVARAFNAEYDDRMFTTPRMRAWVGTRRDQLGHEFAESLVPILLEAGWQCRLEIEPQEILDKKLEKAYGDVDILAWDPQTARTLVIECKNLFIAKTPGEVARQLAEFRGKPDNLGKPDRLMRHLDRVTLLRAYPERIAAFVGMKETTVESILVFRNRVPIEFIDDDVVKQVDIRYPDTLASI